MAVVNKEMNPLWLILYISMWIKIFDMNFIMYLPILRININQKYLKSIHNSNVWYTYTISIFIFSKEDFRTRSINFQVPEEVPLFKS